MLVCSIKNSVKLFLANIILWLLFKLSGMDLEGPYQARPPIFTCKNFVTVKIQFNNTTGSKLKFFFSVRILTPKASFRYQKYNFQCQYFYTEKRLSVSMLPVSVLKFTIKITKKGLCILLTTPCFQNLNLQL